MKYEAFYLLFTTFQYTPPPSKSNGYSGETPESF